jgi:hypothetical protein
LLHRVASASAAKKPLPAQEPGGRYKGNTPDYVVFL